MLEVGKASNAASGEQVGTGADEVQRSTQGAFSMTKVRELKPDHLPGSPQEYQATALGNARPPSRLVLLLLYAVRQKMYQYVHSWITEPL